MKSIFRILAALCATVAPLSSFGDERDTARPASLASEVEVARGRAVALLLELQESYEGRETPDEWPYEGVYKVGGRIPIGYRVGGTSIASLALLDVDTAMRSEAVSEAIERALGFVLEKLDDPGMARGFRGSYDVRGWGHCYALTFLLDLRRRELVPAARADDVEDAIDGLVETLVETEIPERGGWNYSRRRGAEQPAPPSTFMTAPTLQALFEAVRQGESVDEGVLARGLDVLEAARLDSGAFQYTTTKRKSGRGFEAVPGAIARMPVCETTLLLAGRGSVERVRTSLDEFLEHWTWLEKRRAQTGTHVPPYQIAPYYFYYAHYYAAQAIEMLPEAERTKYRPRLIELLFETKSEEGSWNDRVFPRSANFGTAMSLLALGAPSASTPAEWRPTPTPDPEKAE